MSYKNTVKIFASNFMLVWKQLLYLLICALIFALCTYATITPIISLLRENNIFVELKDMIKTVYSSPSVFALNLSELAKHTMSVLATNMSKIWAHCIALVIFAIFIPYILIQMSQYNICSIIYQKASMNMNVGYIQNGMRKFKQSLLYALSSILFNLPFWALSILFIVIYIMSANSIIAAIIGFAILILLLIIEKSLKHSLFSCFIGYMVENDADPFTSFGKGIVIVIKSFGRVFSNSIVSILTIILINGLITIFTFFSGLILTIPASMIFISILYMVIFFNLNEERYYLSNNYIYNPMKYSVKENSNLSKELQANANLNENANIGNGKVRQNSESGNIQAVGKNDENNQTTANKAETKDKATAAENANLKENAITDNADNLGGKPQKSSKKASADKTKSGKGSRASKKKSLRITKSKEVNN